MKLFWLISAVIILITMVILYFLPRTKKNYFVKEKQIAVQIFVFECSGGVENLVRTVMNTYEKDINFNFVPRINLILDNTTEEERKICKILEKEHENITCSYSRDSYIC